MSGTNKTVVVGLDIGTTKIACFVGTKNEHGKIEIISMGKSDSLGVSRGMVFNIIKTVSSIQDAVLQTKANFEKNKNNVELIIRDVNVGIAGQHIKSFQHRGVLTRKSTENEISQADVDELIEDMYRLALEPGEQIIHVLPQEYIVDNEQGIFDPIGMSGKRLEANFHIITGRIDAAMNINKSVEKSGLEVKGVILEPIASAEAVLSEEEKEAGVVLVDIGGGTTDVAIFHDGVIRHTAVIPFGGNIITEDIKEGCQVLSRQAELLKVKFGSALSSESAENEVISIPGIRGQAPREITVRNLAAIIQARMEEIIEHVYYEINNSGFERKLIAGIVVTGGGAQLKHITQLFEYITGMSTRVGLPTEHLASTNDLDLLASPMYATGIGLVMKGFAGIDPIEVVDQPAKPQQIINHSKKSKGPFFDVWNRGKTFFMEDAD